MLYEVIQDFTYQVEKHKKKTKEPLIRLYDELSVLDRNLSRAVAAAGLLRMELKWLKRLTPEAATAIETYLSTVSTARELLQPLMAPSDSEQDT